MSQFRPVPRWDEQEEAREVKKASEEGEKTVPLSQPQAETPDPVPSPMGSTTGHIPIILLTGPHPTPDANMLAEFAQKTPTTAHAALSGTTGTLNRLTVIPADKKLLRGKQGVPARISQARAFRKRWKSGIVLACLALFLLIGFISKSYFLDDPHQASSNIPCRNGCYTSAQSSSHTTFSSMPGNSSASSSHPVPSTITSAWRLTFDEEFDGNGVNWKLWQDGGQNWGSGGNGEEQAYLGSECSVANGLLIVRAENIPANGKQYSSCMLNTMSTFKQTYGYFEFRGKLPKGQGFWPAFWLYESANGGAPEIDVMENLGNDIRTYYMTYHSEAGQQQQVYHGVDLSTAFHTYAVKWQPDAITFYFDNVAQRTITSNIYNAPMFILINLAVGGNWPGSPDASTPFPGYFDVDYVRAYAMP